MRSITIHAFDSALDACLCEEVRSPRKNKNQLIKDLLSRSLGLRKDGAFSDEYRELCGLRNGAEYDSFQDSQAESSRIDEGDWS